MTLNPIVILIGMRISAAATTLGPAVEPSAASSPSGFGAVGEYDGYAVPVAHSLDNAPVAPVSLDKLSGVEATFFNVNTKETETFFLRFDGVMSSDDEKRITHLFRCKRTGHELTPNRGLLQLLAKVADKYQGHVLEIVSAHRHNRGTSRTSKHWSGHAIDLRVQGVNVKDVRAFVWKMEEPIGLGYYREQQFVHMDYRPDEGKIAWDQRTEGSAYHYHPAWAGGPPKKQKAQQDRPSRRKPARSARPNS